MTSRHTRPRTGYTLAELLVAMALVVMILAILGEAFTAGLDSFRELKAAGDLDEKLREDAARLRRDLDETNRRATGFIAEGLLTGKADGATAADLKARYEAIRTAAADVEIRLRRVEQATTHPEGKRFLRASLQALAGLKAYSVRAVDLLDTISPG